MATAGKKAEKINSFIKQNPNHPLLQKLEEIEQDKARTVEFKEEMLKKADSARTLLENDLYFHETRKIKKQILEIVGEK